MVINAYLLPLITWGQEINNPYLNEESGPTFCVINFLLVLQSPRHVAEPHPCPLFCPQYSQALVLCYISEYSPWNIC